MTLPPNAVDLAISELIRNRPDVNTRRGSAVRLLLVDPWAVINQPLVDEARSLRTRMSIANLALLTEDDLDKLAANVMISRRPGRAAHGVARIYFNSPSSFELTQSTRLIAADGTEFAVVANREVTSAELRQNTDGDLYYIDVGVEAVEFGAVGNIDAGEIASIQQGPPSVAKVINLERFIGGEDRETNSQLAARIPDAIAARSIVNQPGARTVVTTQFPEITGIQEVGYGDPEMERDLVSGTNMIVNGEAVGSGGAHIGGKIDLYVRTPNFVQQTVTLVAAAGEVRPVLVFGRAAVADDEVEVSRADLVLNVFSIQTGDPVSGVCTGDYLVEGTDYAVEHEHSGNAYSVRGVTKIRLLEEGSHFAEITEGAGKSLQVTYLTNPDIARVQDFVDNGNVRHVCADVLVKSVIPALIDVDVTFKPTPTERLGPGEVMVTSQDVVDAVREFLAQSDNANGFNIDDLYRVLFTLPVERVNKPISVRVSMVDSAGVTHQMPAADEPDLLLLTAQVPSVPNAIRMQVPDVNLSFVGVSLGDTATLTWAGGSVEREVVGIERATPTDTKLTVLRFSSALPAAGAATLTVKRRTVQNVAGVPRTAAMIARRIRAFELAV